MGGARLSSPGKAAWFDFAGAVAEKLTAWKIPVALT